MGPTDDLSTQLDNPVWAALTTAQANLANTGGDGRAVAFPRDSSPFSGIGEADQASWDGLVELVGVGKVAVFMRAGEVEPPPEWRQVWYEIGTQYVWTDPVEAPTIDTVELAADDSDEMVALTRLTEPGPFLARTHELGRYIGVRREGVLVAMAGQRLRSDLFSEISAVCVHPDARRQGLAAALTLVLAEEIAAQGRTAMLHVRAGNDAAHAVYQGIGFTKRCDMGFYAFKHTPDGYD